MIQFALAAMLSEVIELMKRSDQPGLKWITTQTSLINKGTSVLVAVLSSLAIGVGWVVDPVTGLGTLTLAGIPTTVPGLTALGMTVFEQYWLQKGWYKVVIKKEKNHATEIQHQQSAGPGAGGHPEVPR